MKNNHFKLDQNYIWLCALNEQLAAVEQELTGEVRGGTAGVGGQRECTRC